LLKLLLAASFAGAAWAQSSNTDNQVWPEADVYFKLSPQLRFLYTLRGEADPGNGSGNIANSFYLEFSFPRFHPVFFRRIIKINDARIQRVTFDLGERLIHSVNSPRSTSEERTIVQAALRWAFPFGSMLTDRNRVEFRFVNGAYSWRARDQVKVEKDIRIHGYALTEYVSAEAFFDSKTDSVDRLRYVGGVVFPVAKNTTIEPYFMRQDSRGSEPKFENAIGMRLSLFLQKRNQ
jgi:hypothetical protein